MLICPNYDNTIRWKEGERLDHLFEQRCDQLISTGSNHHPAVIAGEAVMSFEELDKRANQLARYLRHKGVRPGDRVGVLLNKSVHVYISLLAVLKTNAAYVPLDAGFPQERLAFIAKDAGVEKIITLSDLKDRLKSISISPIYIDSAAEEVNAQSTARLNGSEKGIPKDQLCYIIYTSGSTGNPKGVAIEHPSICNFVKVAGEVYGIKKDDRVYQGMTIAFDFSVEEIWVPLIAGATLVPGKPDASLVGEDLADFLLENHVTALCCVPTLLASIERDLPELRFLLVSGETCPPDLVVRWHRPGRTILNAYGPTEATVTATWTELHPEKPLTIGGPLPTYSVVILDEQQKAVPRGASGEICIAGIGLAKGYVNLETRTKESFIHDFLDIPNNPSRRIYRTGDLGRITDIEEIEYLGRIDTQVKIRGYRIELSEIESVLLQVPQIAQAVVSTYTPEPGALELVAYCTLRKGVSDLPCEEISNLLRSRLPGYMIPAYIEKVPLIPMLPSNKADRKKLPLPKGPRFVAKISNFAGARNETETIIANIFAIVLNIEQVSVEDNFFTDLGGHSLLMAKCCAQIRERLTISDLSIRDIYLHPTVAQLSQFLNSKSTFHDKKTTELYRKPTNWAYYVCGAFQLSYYYGMFFMSIAVMILGLGWAFSSTGIIEIYVRLIGFGMFAFLISIFLPISMKWILIGTWKIEKIPVWGLKYFRFWVVKQLVQLNPMVLFKGLPIYNLYLRLLGAKIGKNVVIYSRLVPVCSDLIAIGDNSILRKDSLFLGYKAQSGYIRTGPVTIKKNVFIGEASFLDIDTVMEDDSQLGHASSLQSNQKIPAGKRYHGSPAEESTVNYCSVEPKSCTPLRRFVYSALQVIALFFGIPTTLIVIYVFSGYLTKGNLPLYFNILRSIVLKQSVNDLLLISSVLFIASLILFFVFLLLGLAIIALLPRLVNLFLKPEKTYVLYGFHYFMFRLISGISNSYFYNLLFGDSSYILNYLNFIGLKASKAEQTGSNFGQSQKHDTPFLCEIGKGTMVSDGLSMINAAISNNSFKLSKVMIEERSFFGNNIHFPHDGKMGKNCLIATKAMIPIDGYVRENTGILGSPSFEIPRSVNRDNYILVYKDPCIRRKRIKKKNLCNLYTMASFLIFQWFFTALAIQFAFLTILLFSYYGISPVIFSMLWFPFFSIAYFIFVEKLSLGFKRMKPQTCTIYDISYWKVEHYWKLSHAPLMMLFKGTPFKNIITRLLGVKLGKRVFDDGCYVTEKTLVEIGDYCTLNESSTFQSHSLEDGVFKSDFIRIGKGSTIGCNAFVHYGVKMGDNVVLDPDAFLMKGETLNSNTKWQGNPAREV